MISAYVISELGSTDAVADWIGKVLTCFFSQHSSSVLAETKKHYMKQFNNPNNFGVGIRMW